MVTHKDYWRKRRMQKRNIKIYVCCHKPSYVPASPLFTAVQAGAALAEKHFPNMMSDDSGDNISDKNPRYCELTVQYWVWKNEEADYYGFFHYRRYLSLERIYSLSSDGKRKASDHLCPFREIDSLRDTNPAELGLTKERLSDVVPQYDILTVCRERIGTSVFRQYAQFHDRTALDAVLRILSVRYPAYIDAAKRYLSSRDIYYMNMYFMRREVFQAYMQFLFGILQDFEQQYPEKAMEPRLMGFLAERLFGVFFTYAREHGLRCAEVPYVLFYDTECGIEEGSLQSGRGASGKRTDHSERRFQLTAKSHEICVSMRKLNRLFPAGSRRRILLRNCYFAGVQFLQGEKHRAAD